MEPCDPANSVIPALLVSHDSDTDAECPAPTEHVGSIFQNCVQSKKHSDGQLGSDEDDKVSHIHRSNVESGNDAAEDEGDFNDEDDDLPPLRESWELVQSEELKPVYKSILKTRPRTLTVPITGAGIQKPRRTTLTPCSQASSRRSMDRRNSTKSSGSFLSLSNVPLKQLFGTTKDLWKAAWHKSTSGVRLKAWQTKEWIFSRYFITWLLLRLLIFFSLFVGKC